MTANWGDFPIIKMAGREFQVVPRSCLPFSRGDEGDEKILLPVIPPDDKKDFPGQPAFEGYGPYVKSGITQHELDWMHIPGAWASANSTSNFVAADLVILREDDWYGECWGVLEAHGWTERGNLTEDMKTRIVAAEGNPDLINKAKKKFGENHETFLLEIAAQHFAAPLSRVWYVANMMSLYYCRNDDMRFGFLWAEYQIKMRAELFALKHIEMSERNRENGLKGGQSDKKQERYHVLNKLGRQHFKELAFVSDRDGVRVARRLAAEYDKGSSTPLFQVGGKELSRTWYEEWLSCFRTIARGIE